jgi:hypothetical protein
MKMLLAAIVHESVHEEAKLMIVGICMALLKRSSVVSSTLLYDQLIALTKLATRLRTYRNHPLLLRTKLLLRALFEKYSNSGLFVLLFSFNISKNLSKLSNGKGIDQEVSMESDFVYILASIMGTKSTIQDSSRPISVELQFMEVPLEDILFHLFQYKEMSCDAFTTVFDNLALYIKLFKPQLDLELILCKLGK